MKRIIFSLLFLVAFSCDYVNSVSSTTADIYFYNHTNSDLTIKYYKHGEGVSSIEISAGNHAVKKDLTWANDSRTFDVYIKGAKDKEVSASQVPGAGKIMYVNVRIAAEGFSIDFNPPYCFDKNINFSDYRPLKILKAKESTHVLKKIISKFAPLVIISKNDKSGPSSVNWYLKNCEVRARAISGKTDVKEDIYVSDVTTPESLIYKCYLMVVNDLRAKWAKNGNVRVECYLKPKDAKNVYKGEQVGHDVFTVPCYVNAVYLPQADMLLLQYWFFYSYQGGLAPGGMSAATTKMGFGIHEGDWEQCDVGLKKDSNGDYCIVKLGCSQHGNMYGGELKDVDFVDDVGKISVSGNHPVIYAATNSHAGYFKYIKTANKKMDSTSTFNDGRKWKSWSEVVLLEYEPFSAQRWPGFAGRWGSSVETKIVSGTSSIHGDSPISPAMQGTYFNPGKNPQDDKLY